MNSPVAEAAKGRRVHLAAMLVEMIHVASLIHDDVIDEADMRRGKPSANARWQSHKAVILGDYILAKNMNIGLQSGQFDLVTHVCGSMAALCEGEVLQDECAANSTMTRQAYLDIIYKKTASLLGVSASAGALAVGGLFVAETLSVILQVSYFKASGGKRIFRMAPLHHHYEMKGIPESKIIIRFWIISVMLGLIALSALKLR